MLFLTLQKHWTRYLVDIYRR